MTRNEFPQVLSILQSYYPTQFNLSKMDMEIWYNKLCEFSKEKVLKAIDSAAVESATFVPSLPLLMSKLRDENTSDKSCYECYRELLDNIHKHGRYDAKNGIANLTPVSKEIARLIGYDRLCDMYEDEIERSVSRAYNEIKESPSIQERLANDSVMISKGKNDYLNEIDNLMEENMKRLEIGT